MFLRKTQFLGFSMEIILKKTLSLTINFKYLLFQFILIDVFLKLPYLIPKQFLSGHNLAYALTAVSIFIIFLEPFVYAGYYGLVFLKINSQKIGFKQFIYSSLNNFVTFFYICLVMGGLVFLVGFTFQKILFSMSINLHYSMTLRLYYFTLLRIVISIFFLFSYPLAIQGFFSNKKLKPIRSSFVLLVNNFPKIKFIVLFIIVRTIIPPLLKTILSGFPVYDYIKLLSPVLTTPITFFILIYSYLFIAEYFKSELNYDFEVKT